MTEEEKTKQLPVLEADHVDVIGIPTQGAAVLRVWTEAMTEAEGDEPVDASFDFLVDRKALEEMQSQIATALRDMDAAVPKRPPEAKVH